MHAVSADQNVAADALAALQLDLDAFGILRETHRTGAKSNRVWLQFPHMAFHQACRSARYSR
jgi:hypothetical protein